MLQRRLCMGRGAPAIHGARPCRSVRLLAPGGNPSAAPAAALRGPSRTQLGLPEHRLAARAQAADGSFIETAVKQELGVQSARLPDSTRERVESAIQQLRFRTTVGEAAARSGVKLAEAEEALKALAYDSNAVLQVSGDGDVVYVFDREFRDAIRKKSFALRAKPVLAKAESALSQLVRVVFGTTLFASIVLTAVALAVLMSSRDNDRRRSNSNSSSRSSSGGGFSGDVYLPDIGYYFSPNYGQHPRARKDGNRMSFPESIFSFVFGDGDPNVHFEEQRWRALGQFLQDRHGVVTAEEMAPFLDCVKETPGAGPNDEAYVLPALLRFGGEPFVDEEGHLLYRFPSLQKRTALQKEYAGRRTRRASSSSSGGQLLPRPQVEQPWQLTSARTEHLVGAVALGVVNIVLVTTLGGLVADPAQKAILVREGLGWIAYLLPWFSAYAATFFWVPLVRFVVNSVRNSRIEERNLARELAAMELAAPHPSLVAKLASARKQGESKVITKGDIVFTSELEAGPQQSTRELSDWDSRLRGSKAGQSGEWGTA